MKCTRCGTAAPADAQFCTQCGSPLPEGGRRKGLVLYVAIPLVAVAIVVGLVVFLAARYDLAGGSNAKDPGRGALSVVLNARTPEGDDPTRAQLDACAAILRKRLKGAGLTAFTVRHDGKSTITLRIPAGSDPSGLMPLILGGKLEFMDAKELGTAYPTASDVLDAERSAFDAAPDKMPTFLEAVRWPAEADNPSRQEQWFLATSRPKIDAAMVKTAQVGYDSNGHPNVDLELTSAGAQAFDELTKAMAETGVDTGTTQRLVIVMDGQVKSAPEVKREHSGGMAEITGSFTIEQAKSLALLLNTGVLPLELSPVPE